MTRVRAKTFDYVTSKKYDGMLGRCYRQRDPSYKNYGAKGVRVDRGWLVDIHTFRAWVMKCLDAQGIDVVDFIQNSSKYQLDRIDPSGHYIPENCRFLNPQANMRNRRALNKIVYEAADGSLVRFDSLPGSDDGVSSAPTLLHVAGS